MMLVEIQTYRSLDPVSKSSCIIVFPIRTGLRYSRSFCCVVATMLAVVVPLEADAGGVGEAT
jgi:hypothetical protein